MAPAGDALADFDARPGQSLASHLDGVATNVSRLLADAGTNAYGDDWQTVGRVLAWTHDAGKLTEWFQDYLVTNDRSHAPTNKHTHHGFVSALLTAHALHELDVTDATREAGFYAVAKHHGAIPDVPEQIGNYDTRKSETAIEKQFEIVGDQLANIDSEAAHAADTLVTKATGGALQWADVAVENPAEYSQLIVDTTALDNQFYETLLRAWSSLVCADKLDASGIVVPESTARPSLSKLRTHVAGLPDGTTAQTRRLNTLRTAAHEEAKDEMLAAHANGDRLFRITLPTGFGKTLTGLRAALEVAEEIDGRVIYSLPYTSIIDQVHGEMQDVFDVSAGDPEYTIHHHLADTWTRLDEIIDDGRVSDGSESLYAETWQSGMVLTTFVQLFESLAGPSNVQSMKLPALQDSVIIVDEPQALSLRWWSLVGRLTRFLRDEYDASVIMMTATQPEIFERDKRLPTPTSLTTQFEDCCSFIAEHPRVEFHLDESVAAYLDAPDSAPRAIPDAAAQLVSETAGGGSAPTTLAITNTVESAASLSAAVVDATGSLDGPAVQLADRLLEFYRTEDVTPTSDSRALAGRYLDYLASQGPASPACLVGTLTAQLRPIDRSLLVDALRRRLDSATTTPFDEVPLVTVSTQLIEAGVDISFDRLYRDIGPVPALVQAAGRCNRNFAGPVSPVTVWRLGATDGDAPPSELIYGSRSLLRPTRQALQELRDGESKTSIPEATMISEGVSEYYASLHSQRRTDVRTSELVEQFDTARGASLREASLIEEYAETQDVAMLVSDADREVHETYRNAQDDDDWTRADQAFEDLKQLFVSVPVNEEDTGTDAAFDVVDLSDGRRTYAVRTGRGLVSQ